MARIYLEVQIETNVQRFVMKDRETAAALVETLTPHVGKPMFSRNDDEPRNISIESEDGTAVISLERIYAVRLTDYDVFEAAGKDATKRQIALIREVDAELVRSFTNAA